MHTLKLLPLPTCESSPIVPLCSFTISLAQYNPRPDPLGENLNESPTLENFWNSLWLSFAEIHIPSNLN